MVSVENFKMPRANRVIVSAASVTTVVIFYCCYLNRHKSIKYILNEIRYYWHMQKAAFTGIIDDWMNSRTNKVELPDASGKVAVITGGARGIGMEVVRGLLKANVTVVMGIRKPELATKLAETMENGKNIYAFHLDLESLKSVKEFATKVIEKYPDIHVLINNGAIMFGEYKLTEDGFESQFGVNYLSHFYLTHLLLPVLKKSGRPDECSRIVNVTSNTHYHGKIRFEDVNMKECYHDTAAYAQSKLAQLMSTRYINKLLEIEGHHVKCYSVHPGIVNSDLFQNTIYPRIMPWLMKIIMKSTENGAKPILFACFDKNIRGGLYISNCKEGSSSEFSKKVNHQDRLFKLSCELVGVDVFTFGRSLQSY